MTELSKLHHLRRELENEILCQNRQGRMIRFEERVEEQTPEGYCCCKFTEYQQQFEQQFQFRCPSSSPTANATSMQVDENNLDSSNRQKVTHGADMELEGLVMDSERDRHQRYSDYDFLMQVKQDADVYLDSIFCNDHRKRETAKKELIQLGVHPSVHVAEVFSSPGNARLVYRLGPHTLD